MGFCGGSRVEGTNIATRTASRYCSFAVRSAFLCRIGNWALYEQALGIAPSQLIYEAKMIDERTTHHHFPHTPEHPASFN